MCKPWLTLYAIGKNLLNRYLYATYNAYRLHLKSTDECVQATDNVGRPRSMSIYIYVQAKGKAGRTRLTSGYQCVHAKGDTGRPHPTLADHVCRPKAIRVDNA